MNNGFLAAREQRQAALSLALSEGAQALLFLSLNIPGVDKTPPGATALFTWALREMLAVCPPFSVREVSRDALGDYAIVASGRRPETLKRLAVALETAHPAARLIDIDVYDPQGMQLGRRELGLATRPCLLCEEAAVDCIRVKRHPLNEVMARTHELLSNFKA